MGFGIWAMQFVGMMAFYRLFTGSLIMGVLSLPCILGIDSISRVIIVYDPFLITGSVLAAIAVAFFSLKILFW
ncbi:MHYT domain-containing protein [Bacillus atrophaeus]|uniref:MHYT domain-containing protein n=1 Tax=Bacillus atrophaeus TaxID=1452 RepID=UPI00123A2BC8|nr:MHYT domain-containing protein [Bacillus atrophaeus]